MKKEEGGPSVLERFGLADEEHKPIGQPPITRWDYDGYSVFFENSTVIDVVVKDLADQLRPGLWDSLPEAGRRALKARVHREAPKIVDNILSEMRADLSQFLDMQFLAGLQVAFHDRAAHLHEHPAVALQPLHDEALAAEQAGHHLALEVDADGHPARRRPLPLRQPDWHGDGSAGLANVELADAGHQRGRRSHALDDGAADLAPGATRGRPAGSEPRADGQAVRR